MDGDLMSTKQLADVKGVRSLQEYNGIEGLEIEMLSLIL